ncbi:hypothetical protein KQH82_10540 [bacterium]|nr:hypothetical protein [bacterium]
MNTLQIGIVLLMCCYAIACGASDSTIVQRFELGPRVLTVTDLTEPSPFGGDRRVIAVADTLKTEATTTEVMEIPEYLNVVSIEPIDTSLAMIVLRQGNGADHPFVVFPLEPRVGQLDFPGWWVADWCYASADTLSNSDCLVEIVELKSDMRDHVLVIGDTAKLYWVYNVYFCDAGTLEAEFEDSLTLKVSYGWVGSTQLYEFSISLGRFLGDQIAVRAVGLSDRSLEK